MIERLQYMAATSILDPKSYDTQLPQTPAGTSQLQSTLATAFAIMAALAVLMIVIAGLRFVVGQASPQEVSKARNTIIYAVAGLLVAIAAEAIVALVLGKL